MTDKRLSLGINVSILLILTIFGVLLSLPLRLLLNTNYDVQNHEGEENEGDTDRLSKEARDKEMLELLIDNRKLKQCRGHGYEDRVRSIFYSDYDENCIFVQALTIKDEAEEAKDSFKVTDVVVRKEEKKRVLKVERTRNEVDDDDDDDDDESQESKEIVVAGHILVTMLLVSAIAALVEVLRIRFSKDKSKRLKGRISLTKE